MYFKYTREDYKNLYVSLTMDFDEDDSSLTDLYISLGILKRIENGLNSEWSSVLGEKDSCLLEIDEHQWIISFLDFRIKKFKEIVRKNKKHYWRDEYKSYVKLLSIARQALINKGPVMV